jgi:response regulator RpfG family c-di-GMP phosphodiesterase
MSAAPLKIMIVDDQPPIRKLLRMGLSTQGYDIIEAPMVIQMVICVPISTARPEGI